MKSLAIITARGGSKRIPGKNIRKFLGRPIMAYSIEAALNSGAFNEVMVSTDSHEIAELAAGLGASVPFMRSEKTSNDYATTSDVILEVLEEYAKMGEEITHACCIYPTAPFVTGEKLKLAMERLISEKADTVFPVLPFSYPPQRGLAVREGVVEFVYPEHTFTRTQDLEPMYHDAGQFYAINTAAFMKSHSVISGRVLPLIITELEAQDIDTETDWKLAELKYELMKEEQDGK